jgi:predicted ATPase
MVVGPGVKFLMSAFFIRTLSAHLPLVGPRVISMSTDAPGRSYATVVIGRNGSGKSTLLRDITYVFRAIASMDVKPKVQKPQGMLLDAMVVSNDERNFDIDAFNLATDGRVRAGSLSHALPTRLIALSFTPFDRFPARDDLSIDRVRGMPLTDNPFYVYLGFKTEAGRASPRARLLHVVSTLAYRQSEASEDARVARTLNAIGYAPELVIEYSISNPIRQELRTRRGSPRSLIREPSNFERDRADMLEQSDVANAFPRLLAGEHVDLFVNFQTGDHRTIDGVRKEALERLVAERALVVSAVKLRRVDRDETIDLLELSSGELNLLSGFLGLAAHLVDGSLVLIDEPENSLHPAWQSTYVEQLRAIFAQHAGCHYIVATHSPLIVSTTAAEPTCLVRLDQAATNPDAEWLRGESSDATLVKAFDVVSAGNNYIRQIVLEALTLVEDGQAEKSRAKLLGRFLRTVRPHISSEDPVAPFVDALVTRIPL